MTPERTSNIKNRKGLNLCGFFYRIIVPTIFLRILPNGKNIPSVRFIASPPFSADFCCFLAVHMVMFCYNQLA